MYVELGTRLCFSNNSNLLIVKSIRNFLCAETIFGTYSTDQPVAKKNKQLNLVLRAKSVEISARNALKPSKDGKHCEKRKIIIYVNIVNIYNMYICNIVNIVN